VTFRASGWRRFGWCLDAARHWLVRSCSVWAVSHEHSLFVHNNFPAGWKEKRLRCGPSASLRSHRHKERKPRQP
jgi:hypothetical protein